MTDLTIPQFASYRTVEATYADLAQLAASHPTLAQWVDIGDSYDKATPGGKAGYDLFALQLGQTTGAAKPILFLQAAIHGQDYATTELVTRFAEDLVAGYGVDPDATWLLDQFEIRIVPIVNPDGRKLAEAGNPWRKNANPTPPVGTLAAPFPTYGVNLDRNFDLQWHQIPDRSTDPASPDYAGSVPFSEPETQALRDYLQRTFVARLEATVPGFDRSGVFINLQSSGNEILYPQRWTTDPTPDYAELRNLGLKLAYFTDRENTTVPSVAYDVRQGSGRGLATGTAIDWVYQNFGVASYQIAAGTQAFEPSSTFETTIAPQLLPTLIYAAKSAYRPYQTPLGPDVQSISLSNAQIISGLNSAVTVSTTIHAGHFADGNGASTIGSEGTVLPTAKIVTGARVSIDLPSWSPDAQITNLPLADGDYDSPVETMTGAVDVSNLSPGRHILFVEGLDASGNYGVPTAVFLDVLEIPENASVLRGNAEDNVWTTNDNSYLVLGEAGNDQIQTGAGKDLILAGAGDDGVMAGDQNDQVYGNVGDDQLEGGAGDDWLLGEAGDDRLIGGADSDVLWGGAGDDTLVGGAGADTFALATDETGTLISDFEVGLDRFGLMGTLRFDQLTIALVSGTVQIQLGETVLAQIPGVSANAITADAFVPLSPTFNLE